MKGVRAALVLLYMLGWQCGFYFHFPVPLDRAIAYFRHEAHLDKSSRSHSSPHAG